MKKVLVLVAVFALTMGSAFAQKGTWYVGTSAMTSVTDLEEPGTAFVTGFIVGKAKDPFFGDDLTVTSFGIAPEAGYFLSDKFSVGLGVAFNLTKVSEDRRGDVKTTSFGINPYARYFLISKGNFGFYMQGGLSYVSSKDDSDDAEAFNTFYIGINPGVCYKLGDNFGVTASFGNLGYTSYGEDVSAFGLNVDMSSLRFGLHYSF